MPISLLKVFRFLHSTCLHCKGEKISYLLSPHLFVQLASVLALFAR